jgi:hypothetical protein
MMMRLISLFLFCLAPAQVQAFGTAPARVPATSTNTRRASFAPRTGTGVSLKIAIQLQLQQSPTQLWSQPEEKEEDAVEVEVNPRLEGTQYPIDIASPILLATSMILAILCTGMLMLLMLMLWCVKRCISIDRCCYS